MGLCPSNNVVKGFPTLGDPPFSTEFKEVAMTELAEAGAPRGSPEYTSKEVQVWREGTEAWKIANSGIHFPGMGAEEDKEWIEVHSVSCNMYGWNFRRAWYYWIATNANGPAIEFGEALRLDEEFGDVLRVNGFAGGQRPTGSVGSYHVDRPDALSALIASLKKSTEEAQAKWNRKDRR